MEGVWYINHEHPYHPHQIFFQQKQFEMDLELRRIWHLLQPSQTQRSTNSSVEQNLLRPFILLILLVITPSEVRYVCVLLITETSHNLGGIQKFFSTLLSYLHLCQQQRVERSCDLNKKKWSPTLKTVHNPRKAAFTIMKQKRKAQFT